MADLDSKEFKLVHPLAWADVFDIWRKNEADDPKWDEVYKSRGFNSWEEWRRTYTNPLGLAGKKWFLYEILDPMKTIPDFRGGPFATWVERYYGGEQLPTFRRIVEHPGIQEHEGINRLAQDFPEETSLIGLYSDKGVVILEGMHRCCAVALAAKRQESINGTVLIALAEFPGDTLPVLGQVHQGN